ncbi:uncharacterized protein METZ01_LOCUS269687 [marine metagenome]|uniref:Prolyl 4-hydroxylase alpha subunit Fe(2+) 2OG dioxygenase domain-containing protein n=1 Tax=marine metagenome TaxID=408172 RepID=A0A382JZX9_9ZZZZ
MINSDTKQFLEGGDIFTTTYPDAETIKPLLSKIILDYDKIEQTYHKEPTQTTFVNSTINKGPQSANFRKLFQDNEYFKKITDFALDTIKEALPLFPNMDRFNNDPYILDCWGVLYKPNTSKETWTLGLEPHYHWPATWAFTYYIDACKDCAPIVFPNCQDANLHFPKTGLLIIFPGWIAHAVPPHKCNHNRFSIAGNVAVNL